MQQDGISEHHFNAGADAFTLDWKFGDNYESSAQFTGAA